MLLPAVRSCSADRVQRGSAYRKAQGKSFVPGAEPPLIHQLCLRRATILGVHVALFATLPLFISSFSRDSYLICFWPWLRSLNLRCARAAPIRHTTANRRGQAQQTALASASKHAVHAGQGNRQGKGRGRAVQGGPRQGRSHLPGRAQEEPDPRCCIRMARRACLSTTPACATSSCAHAYARALKPVSGRSVKRECLCVATSTSPRQAKKSDQSCDGKSGGKTIRRQCDSSRRSLTPHSSVPAPAPLAQRQAGWPEAGKCPSAKMLHPLPPSQAYTFILFYFVLAESLCIPHTFNKAAKLCQLLTCDVL